MVSVYTFVLMVYAVSYSSYVCYLLAHTVSRREVTFGQGRILSTHWSSTDKGGRTGIEDSTEKDTEQGADNVC